MDEKTKARFKDEILKYLIDWSSPVTVESITLNALGRHIEYTITRHLCDEIITSNNELLEKINDHDTLSYEATPVAEDFLKKGGFIKLYETSKTKNAFWKKIKDYTPIAISVLGLCVSFAAYYRPLEESKSEENYIRLERMEKELKSLKINDSTKLNIKSLK